MQALTYSSYLEATILMIAIVCNMALAFVVYRSNPKSATNSIFALLTLCTMLWLVVTYVVRLPVVFSEALWLHRLGIFFAAPMSLFFFLLAHTLPAEQVRLPRRAVRLSFLATFAMMVANISPYAFTGVTFISGGTRPEVGLGIIPFSLISTLFSILAVVFLVRSYRQAEGTVKKQTGLMLVGVLLMLLCITGTILLPLVAFNSLFFLPFTPLYALIFLSLTAYAITKYQLFNIKVLLTQALVLLINVILFAKIFGDESVSARVNDIFVLLCMVAVGFFLVRSVRLEVEQRELVEIQEHELEQATVRQKNLLHFLSHEVKGYLSKSLMGFSAISDGDYGPTTPAMKKLVKTEVEEMHKGVDTVVDILNAGNFKSGNVTYTFVPFDLELALSAQCKEFQPNAEEKHLTYTFATVGGPIPQVLGDETQLLKHVFHNLIDNAIKYTPTGSVAVIISTNTPKDTVTVSVKDSGVGVSDEDKKVLFTEGGRGKDSLKVNVHSTGFGLFIAKTIVDAHKGRIWVESEGAGKGSTFFVTLPAVPPAAKTLESSFISGVGTQS